MGDVTRAAVRSIICGAIEDQSYSTSGRLEPEPTELELDLREGLDPGGWPGVRAKDREDDPVSLGEPHGLERSQERVNKPDAADPFASVDGKLFRSVDDGCRRRKHLAYPVRSELESRYIRNPRHAFPTPAGKVGNENISMEVKLWLIQDPPSPWSARPAFVTMKRPKIHSQNRCGVRMGRSGPRRDDKVTSDDLANNIVWELQEILVRGSALLGLHHQTSIARSMACGA